MGLYAVPLSMSLLGFGLVTMLANFFMCGIMLVLRAVFNMLVRNVSPRGPMCIRCLMFILSGPCEFLLLLCFIASWIATARCMERHRKVVLEMKAVFVACDRQL